MIEPRAAGSAALVIKKSVARGVIPAVSSAKATDLLRRRLRSGI